MFYPDITNQDSRLQFGSGVPGSMLRPWQEFDRLKPGFQVVLFQTMFQNFQPIFPTASASVGPGRVIRNRKVWIA